MSDEHEPPTIKVTDRRHFERSGEKRPEDQIAESPKDSPSDSIPPTRTSPKSSSPPGAPPPEASAGRPPAGGRTPPDPDTASSAGPSRAPAAGDLSDVALGLSSSFSLLIARLAQETEIYLGLVPYPGKETAEPDLEAARAMIDVLTMLQEKTRGNLDEQESHLLENLLYTYRLEFVRRRSGGDIR